jgi:hypothetical protein
MMQHNKPLSSKQRKALVVGNVFGVVIMAKEVFVTLSLLQII